MRHAASGMHARRWRRTVQVKVGDAKGPERHGTTRRPARPLALARAGIGRGGRVGRVALAAGAGGGAHARAQDAREGRRTPGAGQHQRPGG